MIKTRKCYIASKVGLWEEARFVSQPAWRLGIPASFPCKLVDFGHITFSEPQFSLSVMSDSLWPHESQHARPPCPSFTQIHVHRVGDAIQPSHPLLSPSPPAPNPSQHQGLFQWVHSSHEVPQGIGVSASASVLPMNTQDWSPSEWTGWISLQSKGLPRVFSNTTVQKHQFFGTQLSSQSSCHIHTWPLEKP